jgi:hypothetical protein
VIRGETKLAAKMANETKSQNGNNNKSRWGWRKM